MTLGEDKSVQSRPRKTLVIHFSLFELGLLVTFSSIPRAGQLSPSPEENRVHEASLSPVAYR